MSKHTPSPWKVKEGHDNDSGLKLHRVMFGAGIVAECYGVNSAYNARLIAAAPDLMEAIVRLEFAAQCRDNTMGDPCRLIAVKAELAAAAAQARAAIAKATGG